MKKRVWIFLSFLLALILTACGMNLPADLSEEPATVEESVFEDTAADDTTLTDTRSMDDTDNSDEEQSELDGDVLPEHGTYTSKEDVALYLHLYGNLPSNFITKKEAQDLGWEGGSLEPYAPGKCIGGSHFGNYEGILPEQQGRSYQECDIDTLGANSRGAKRIVYSNDGLIYYTEDHYASFDLLYGEE